MELDDEKEDEKASKNKLSKEKQSKSKKKEEKSPGTSPMKLRSKTKAGDSKLKEGI